MKRTRTADAMRPIPQFSQQMVMDRTAVIAIACRGDRGTRATASRTRVIAGDTATR